MSHEHAPKTDVLPLLDISLIQILPVRFMPYKVLSMKKSIKEKLWSILIEDGRAKVFRDNVALKSCHSGQEYECLIGVTVKVQSNKTFIQVSNNLRCKRVLTGFFGSFFTRQENISKSTFYKVEKSIKPQKRLCGDR